MALMGFGEGNLIHCDVNCLCIANMLLASSTWKWNVLVSQPESWKKSEFVM